MEKTTVRFRVSGQELTMVGNYHRFASNSVGLVRIEVEPSDEWLSFDSVDCIFQNDQDRTTMTMFYEFSAYACMVPADMLSRISKVLINLSGKNMVDGDLVERLTTYPTLAFVVDVSSNVANYRETVIPANQYEQFVELVGRQANKLADVEVSAHESDVPEVLKTFSPDAPMSLDFGLPRGAAAGFGTATASIDDNVGTPSVEVTTSGPDTAKVFNFAFSNMKGNTGEKGDTGDAAGFGTVSATVDANHGTPAVTVTTSGDDTAKNFAFDFKNLQPAPYDDSVIQARMDTFTNLAQGSTTGDAELADGRVGADGVTYTNIGGAIRGQVTDLKSELNETDIKASIGLINITSDMLESGAITNAGVDAANDKRIRTKGYIRVWKGSVIKFTAGINILNYAFNLYDTSKTHQGQYAWLSNDAELDIDGYIRIVFRKGDGTGTVTTSDYDADVNVCSPLKMKADSVDAVRNDLLQIEEIEYHEPKNLLNFSDENFAIGKYINDSNGNLVTSSSYNTSGFIPVEEGTTYTYSYGNTVGTAKQMRFICAFDKNKVVVPSAGAESVGTYTVPTGVKYIRFSADSSYFKATTTNIMFYKGTSIDQYHEYFDPYYTYKIKGDALDSDYLDDLITEKVIEYAQTEYGLSITAKVASLTSADTLTVVQNIDNRKNAVIEFIGYFDSFASVSVGHGYLANYGNYVEIDDTHLTVYADTTPTQITQVSHGLNISDFIHVRITQNDGARGKIQIMTASGDYTLNDCSWHGCRGDVFAKVGASMTDCICTAIFKDFNEKVFLFGDSYTSMGDPARFPYYLVQNDYTNLLISGWGGAKSAWELPSFNNIIGYAVPKFAVWALGMNDDDSSSAVNASWLNCVQSFIATCEEKGITPILATIPNVPNINHTFKNAWVRASGYRYVDFAKAVGAEEAGSTWYAGMLSNDNVHPAVLGAKALFARFIMDVPEVIK